NDTANIIADVAFGSVSA
ncbi:hypothetical protein D046_5066B, partial [Vibrio parahaemolyticus V-223/04]